MNQTPTVMYYIKDAKKEKALSELCKDLQLHTRKIKPGDSNRAIGNLAGSPGKGAVAKEKAPAGYQLPELLIFSALEDKKLDEFLAEYRKRTIPPVGLKAIVTSQNINWSLYELTRELMREQMTILMSNRERR